MSSSPWFGRLDDVQAVLDALSEGARLALTGPPGVGKSRVIHEVLTRWPGEVVLCELSGASSRGEVVDRMAGALALQSEGEAPIGPALAGRPKLLLVLDHAEAVGGELPRLLEEWGGAWSCVVGSRIRLSGLRSHEVRPLDLAAGRELYRHRASRFVPDWRGDDEEVDRLLTALDGLPLAIELAASRVRVFPPSVLQGRLSDGLAGLDGALDVSWDLLDADGRHALAALAPVHGEFDAADFEALTGAGPEVLEALLDASLVRMLEPGKFELLGTVRRFAVGREGATPGRHDAWVIDAVQSALAAHDWPRVEARRADLAAIAKERSDAALLLARVRCERGPFADPGSAPPDCADPVEWSLVRAALLGRLGAHGRALDVLSAVEATGAQALRKATLEVLQWTQIRPTEAAARVHAVEARLDDGTGPERAEGLLAIAITRFLVGDRAGALRDLERGRAALSGPHGELHARLLAYLAIVARPDGLGASEENLLRAADLYRELGNARREAMVRSWYGVHAHDMGALDAAHEALERAAILAGRCGDLLMQAEIRGHQVDLALEQGDLGRAEALLAQVREFPTRPPVLVAHMRSREGRICLGRGEEERAREAFEDAAARFDALDRPGLATHQRLLHASLGGPEAGALLARAEAASDALDDQHREGVRVVRQALSGEPIAPVRRPGLALRALLAQVDPGVRVARDGSWIEGRPGGREDLSAKPVLRRLTEALARAGEGTTVGRDALVASTWPSERMRADSATGRLHAAVRTLRKLGLELETTESGGALAYRLGPRVRVVDP